MMKSEVKMSSQYLEEVVQKMARELKNLGLTVNANLTLSYTGEEHRQINIHISGWYQPVATLNSALDVGGSYQAKASPQAVQQHHDLTDYNYTR